MHSLPDPILDATDALQYHINTACHEVVSSCKVVLRSLSAREGNTSFNPLPPRMWCQSGIRCHGCLAVRQPPDASHVSLSQALQRCSR